MNLVFTYKEFLEHFNGIKNKLERLRWAVRLSKELDNIYRNYTDEQYTELYNKYNLSKLNDTIQKQTYFPTDNPRIQKSTYKYFILYLQELYLNLVNTHIFKLKLELKNEFQRKYYSKKDLPDAKRFPLHDYSHILIEHHCNEILYELKDKIRYYDYVLRMFYREFKGREFLLEYGDGRSKKKAIELIKRDFESLKLEYELNKVNIIPKKKVGRPKSIHSKRKSICKKSELKKIYDRNKLVWLGSKKQLIKLFQELQENDYIRNNLEKDPDCEKILPHFVDKDNKPFTNVKSSAKIRLGKNISDLLYVYQNIAFVNNKLLSDILLWIKTAKIFVTRDGSKLYNKRLSASFHQLSDMERPNLDEIINRVYKS